MPGSRRRALAMAAVMLLAACAQTPRAPQPSGAVRTFWNGRMALRIDSDPVQSFHGAFELRGDARGGELTLFTPLGSTVARLAWSPGSAILHWDGRQRSFDSIQALTREATGAEIPLDGLFRWLNGEPAQVDGWSADLQALPDGKLLARRAAPEPAVQMRLVIE